MKSIRKLISIDEELCDGCGNCVPSCVEGALQVKGGKARLVTETYCDGLGACLGECPQGALRIVEVAAEPFDETAAMAHVSATGLRVAAQPIPLQGSSLRSPDLRPTEGPSAPIPLCPSVEVKGWDGGMEKAAAVDRQPLRSELRQWPVQLHLVPPNAPFFQGADLTLVADCVPFAVPDFHAQFLKGTAVAVGCPKLDDSGAYVRKVTQILESSDVRSLKVAYMEVPCCRGLVMIAEQALRQSGKSISFRTEMVRVRS